MPTHSRRRRFLVIPLAMAALTAGATGASASHSWGGYHWARTTRAFTLQLGDNVTSVWDPYLATGSADWTTSTVLDTTVALGRSRVRRCPPTSGRVEVCNKAYGFNGWLA